VVSVDTFRLPTTMITAKTPSEATHQVALASLCDCASPAPFALQWCTPLLDRPGASKTTDLKHGLPTTMVDALAVCTELYSFDARRTPCSFQSQKHIQQFYCHCLAKTALVCVLDKSCKFNT
jgi:hypothetical protein